MTQCAYCQANLLSSHEAEGHYEGTLTTLSGSSRVRFDLRYHCRDREACTQRLEQQQAERRRKTKEQG